MLKMRTREIAFGALGASDVAKLFPFSSHQRTSLILRIIIANACTDTDRTVDFKGDTPHRHRTRMHENYSVAPCECAGRCALNAIRARIRAPWPLSRELQSPASRVPTSFTASASSAASTAQKNQPSDTDRTPYINIQHTTNNPHTSGPRTARGRLCTFPTRVWQFMKYSHAIHAV